MHVIEVVLGSTAKELSEVRCDGTGLHWFDDHDEALAFAERYAATLEADSGARSFISVCAADGVWISLAALRARERLRAT